MLKTLCLILLLPLFAQSAKFDNELCKPRSTLVAIDKPSFKFFPYFVKLDRCGGSCNDIQPSIKSCVPVKYNEVSVSVKMVSTGETKIIKERNHTHCGCQCVITLADCNLELEDWRPDLCQCKCKFGDKPPTPCRDGFRWSKKDCRCICDKAPETCPSNKVWSATECKCVCKDKKYKNCARQNKIVNEDTCRCMRDDKQPGTSEFSGSRPQQKGELSHEFYIGLFLGQFVFLYFVFDAILYHKKAGLIYRVTRSFCTNKGDRSNIECPRENVCCESNNTAVTDIGQRNVAACCCSDV